MGSDQARGIERELLRMITDVYRYLDMGYLEHFNDVDRWLTRSRIDTVNDNHQNQMWGSRRITGTCRGGTRARDALSSLNFGLDWVLFSTEKLFDSHWFLSLFLVFVQRPG